MKIFPRACTISVPAVTKAIAAQIGARAAGNIFLEELPNRPVANPKPSKYSVGVAETVVELSRWRWHKEWCRATRAVMLLEHLGSLEAVKVLEAMATGHADASPTIAAKQALERLKRN
jgi:hypothetical protein